ncbi:NmrA family NAD(P)-binding protein [Curtobacterium sp. RRHDQ10]|uniref:NmrA family NAD(P)-binding protein n=1 Tax=Curtobacterium phyllosphaerae TaxID=3413379 RepID=UPI003BEF7445
MPQTVLIAGATGTLGNRIAHHLTDSPGDEVAVRLLVRDPSPSDAGKRALLDGLTGRGATLVQGDLADEDALRAAVEGVDVVVSAVQGGPDVIVDGQVRLARAAAGAGARRFIPSDFALDIWNAPSEAPMFAMRRSADAAIDDTGLEVLHVLNGAFMDMMTDPRTAGVVDLAAGAGRYWGAGDDPFDVTLIEDVARFTARLAVDTTAAPGVHAISGSRVTFSELIDTAERVTGSTFSRERRGGEEDLRRTIETASNPWHAIGAWYNLSMLTTPPFATVENDRYPDARPSTFEEYLRAIV